jgi:hypothetical protein
MFKVGLENNTEGRSQAWVLGHPGCFAYGKDGPAALEAVPAAIDGYRKWIAAHTSHSWLDTESGSGCDYELDETWGCYSIDSSYQLADNGYEVNAWFRHDWLPLSLDDIKHGLLLLEWGRQDLYNTVGNIDKETLARTYPQERWSIAGILNHIGGAEWWYQDRLGLVFERKAIPDEPFERLEIVRSNLLQVLPGLAGINKVIGVSGEIWSPRKLLRRAVWHEYDHIVHIRKLL